MSWQTVLLWALAIVSILLIAKPLGSYIFRVFTFQPTLLDRPLHPLESFLFRHLNLSPDSTMTAKQYAVSLLVVNFVWIIIAYLVMRLQGLLPFNPEHLSGVNPRLAFNTATSFGTNTDWQAYNGENTMSYLSQFGALQFLMFATPATGGAAAVAFMRSVSGRPLGNFFVDLTLMLTRVFVPLSAIFGLLLIGCGVPDTLAPYLHVHTLAGSTQLIPRGPIGGWEAIEHLGQNGGGFTGANSANPLENPTALSNFVESIAMLIVPVAFFFAAGRFFNKMRLAWMLTAVSGAFFMILLACIYFPEMAGNPIVNALGLHGHANRVGTEYGYGMGGTAFFTTASLTTATGSVNSALDSFVPISSLALFVAMFLNLVFGATGSGFLNMMILLAITV
ncbi:MAG: potassium-transporting ATPase subunit KdpA, partial [Firmicutes bacterium]|nr:potassium-transporting ATPase subunit KdpA [Bacillota bacterium]